jgi:hypothetical protein
MEREEGPLARRAGRERKGKVTKVRYNCSYFVQFPRMIKPDPIRSVCHFLL